MSSFCLPLVATPFTSSHYPEVAPLAPLQVGRSIDPTILRSEPFAHFSSACGDPPKPPAAQVPLVIPGRIRYLPTEHQALGGIATDFVGGWQDCHEIPALCALIVKTLGDSSRLATETFELVFPLSRHCPKG